MNALTYRWSGDHKTIIDIGNNDSLLIMAISNQIESYKKLFRSCVHKVYIEHEYDFYDLKRAKNDIRKLRQLYEVIDSAFDDAVTDIDDARAALMEFV